MSGHEKLAAFSVDRNYSIADRQMRDRVARYDPKDLVTRDVCVGMTGSDKTSLSMTVRMYCCDKYEISRSSIRIAFALVLFPLLCAQNDASAALEYWQGDAGVDVLVTNELGFSLQSARLGEDLLIQSNITNNAAERTSFVHVLQIKDRDNTVTFIDSTLFDLKSGERRTAEFMWHSESEGDHAIQVFAWRNVESPITFSFLSTQVRINPASDLQIECTGSASCFRGTVTRVVDGDTIDVNDITIRFTLVDTPERGEDGYEEATTFTARLCPVGSEAFVDEDDGQRSGSYGRMIAKVYCGAMVINEELLVSQNAIILAEHCAESEFSVEGWAKRYGC